MDKKLYTCHFYMIGGASGEVEYKLDVQFELTDEEYNQALEALGESNDLNDDFPEAMYEAIWDAALDQLYEDAADYQLGEVRDIDEWIPGWRDLSTAELVEVIRRNSDLRDELFAMDCVPELIGGVSCPEEVMHLAAKQNHCHSGED